MGTIAAAAAAALTTAIDDADDKIVADEDEDNDDDFLLFMELFRGDKRNKSMCSENMFKAYKNVHVLMEMFNDLQSCSTVNISRRAN